MLRGSKSRHGFGKMMLIAVTIAVISVTFFAGRSTAPDLDEGSGPPSTGPVETEERPTVEGALDAATSIAQVMAAPSGDARSYLATAEEVAAPGWEERARELAQGALSFIVERYGEGASVAFHPIRHRVRSSSPEEAEVDVWGVVLASGPKRVGVEASWVTASLSLTWTSSGWKVDGQLSRSGPTPELLGTTEEVPVEEVLAEFEEYDR